MDGAVAELQRSGILPDDATWSGEAVHETRRVTITEVPQGVDPWRLAGDYRWKLPSGNRESIFRLKEGGQWWHAAHINRPSERSSPGQESMWEVAECVGSWQEVAEEQVLLSVDNVKWTSDSEDETASLQLRPSQEACEVLEDLVADERVKICFRVRSPESMDQRRLEIEERHETMYLLRMPEESEWFDVCQHRMQAIYKALGIVRCYHEGHAAEDEMELDEAWSKGDALLHQKSKQRYRGPRYTSLSKTQGCMIS